MMIALSILVFLIMFSFLIVIHEFGHFYAAKKSGVKVLEFAVGFGKKLYGKKIGETEFNLNLIPFGGFVRMEGEEEESNDPRSFKNAKLWKQMIITLAGVFMNFCFAIFAFTILFSIGTDPIFVSKEEIRNAYENNIVSLEDEEGTLYSITETPIEEAPEKFKIVINEQVKLPVHEAFLFSFSEIYRISEATVKRLGELPAQIIREKAVPNDLAGPVGLAQITHYFVPEGFWAIFRLAALISIALGVMNLLPIPALDGGRFFFQVVQAFLRPFRVKMNENVENYIHFGGYVILMGFIVLITWNDIVRIFSGF